MCGRCEWTIEDYYCSQRNLGSYRDRKLGRRARSAVYFPEGSEKQLVSVKLLEQRTHEEVTIQ